MTVIAAHCATKSGLGDPDYFDDWVAMLAEFPNLYGDISAMVSLESVRASARVFATRKFCRAFCTGAIFRCRCWDIGFG